MSVKGPHREKLQPIEVQFNYFEQIRSSCGLYEFINRDGGYLQDDTLSPGTPKTGRQNTRHTLADFATNPDVDISISTSATGSGGI